MISLAGELLAAAGLLLRDGLHTSEVADGYAAAGAKVQLIAQQSLITSAPYMGMLLFDWHTQSSLTDSHHNWLMHKNSGGLDWAWDVFS